MSKKLSMQEQLLKVGLISDAKAKTIKTEKHKQQQAQRHHKIEIVDESKQLAQRALQEKAEHDRLLNLKQQEQLKQKELHAQINQLINDNKLKFDVKLAEIAYHFTHNAKIKTVYVTEALRVQLAQGKLAIVKEGKYYELVDAETALKIKERHKERILAWNTLESENNIIDDPYAAFEIPDDLMW